MPEQILSAFQAAMAARHLLPPIPMVADGRMHRCDTDDGASGRNDGSYLLFMDAFPAGGFINWRDGLGWQNWAFGDISSLPLFDRARYRLMIDRAKHEREVERLRRLREAQKRADVLWAMASPPDPQHPYLVAKGVRAHGLRQSGDALLVPAYNMLGEWYNVQRIWPDGTKRFLSGGRQLGCIYIVGSPTPRVAVVEGYATGAAVYEATGMRTVISFTADNLKKAACMVRTADPNVGIVICADNDPPQRNGRPGVGIPKAREAASMVRGYLAIPDFGPERIAGKTDFDDLSLLAGPDAIRGAVDLAIGKGVLE